MKRNLSSHFSKSFLNYTNDKQHQPNFPNPPRIKTSNPFLNSRQQILGSKATKVEIELEKMQEKEVLEIKLKRKNRFTIFFNKKEFQKYVNGSYISASVCRLYYERGQ